MRVLSVASALFLCLIQPSPARQNKDVDAEQLSRDMIKSIDDWVGRANEKLQSGKSIIPEDFDSVFGESFFSDSEDPVRDLELAQKRINDKLGPSPELGDSYGKWFEKKLSPSDFNPKVSRDSRHITVRLKVPEKDQGSLKIGVSGSLIKMDYTRADALRVSGPDGSETFPAVTRKLQRAMAVPKDADPSRYKVKTAKDSMSIVFDRLKKSGQRREASR